MIGPPAVGKMTVGRAVCARTGFRLFHNHMSIEPLLGVFDFGTPSFERLNLLIRREVIAESVAADLPGLFFTSPSTSTTRTTSPSCASSSSRSSVLEGPSTWSS